MGPPFSLLRDSEEAYGADLEVVVLLPDFGRGGFPSFVHVFGVDDECLGSYFAVFRDVAVLNLVQHVFS